MTTISRANNSSNNDGTSSKRRGRSKSISSFRTVLLICFVLIWQLMVTSFLGIIHSSFHHGTATTRAMLVSPAPLSDERPVTGETDKSSSSSNRNNNNSKNKKNGFVLQLQDPSLTTIRFDLYEEAVDATRFLQDLVSQHASADSGGGCQIYRAEPVPEWWGSLDRPDAWFDGGRWGPPYALLQGQLQTPGPSGRIPNAAASDGHRIEIKRGMVAWAGGQGGPHFFIAMADHPEWKTSHVVWARVASDEDMKKLDELLMTRPKKTIVPKRPPILSYFVEPVLCSVTMGY